MLKYAKCKNELKIYFHTLGLCVLVAEDVTTVKSGIMVTVSA
jgi:hypothetical protein